MGGDGISSGDYFIKYSTGSLEDRYQDKHSVTLLTNNDDFITGNTIFPAIENLSDDIRGNITGIKYLRYPNSNDILVTNATAGKIYGGIAYFNLIIYIPFPAYPYSHSVLHDDLGINNMIEFSGSTIRPPYYIAIGISNDYESPSTNWIYNCMTYCHAYDYDNNITYDFQWQIIINGNQ